MPSPRTSTSDFVVVRVSGDDPAAVVQSALPTFDDQSWLAAASAPLPSEVTNLARLRSTPNLLLGMLLVLLGAAVVHALLVAFRARRHDVRRAAGARLPTPPGDHHLAVAGDDHGSGGRDRGDTGRDDRRAMGLDAAQPAAGSRRRPDHARDRPSP